MRWAGHVARMEESMSAFQIYAVNLRNEAPRTGLGVDERTMLQWILKNYMGW
jgi:hypothetical protein